MRIDITLHSHPFLFCSSIIGDNFQFEYCFFSVLYVCSLSLSLSLSFLSLIVNCYIFVCVCVFWYFRIFFIVILLALYPLNVFPMLFQLFELQVPIQLPVSFSLSFFVLFLCETHTLLTMLSICFRFLYTIWILSIGLVLFYWIFGDFFCIRWFCC